MTRPRRQREPSPEDGIDARTLPHNLEAERSVLGAILVHNDAYELAAQVLSSKHFYRDAHRRIFAAIARLIDERHGAVDFVTLKEELARTSELDEVGGPAYIASLADGVPRATNVTYYAGIVCEKALLRDVIYACNTILTAAYEAEDPAADILQRADTALLALCNGTAQDAVLELPARLPEIFKRIEHRVEHKGELTGITTGFPSIDAETLGWQRGDLIVIAARPSIGKTAFALNTAVAAGRAGHRVLIFSIEMRKTQLEDRLLASLAGVDAARIRSGQLGGVDYRRISEALEMMANLPITLDDRRGLTVAEIRAACRRQRADRGLGLVAIDYVQLMPGSLERRGATRNEEVTDISRRVKTMAEELNVPVLLLSQLSRASEKRPDPRPKLSDLRESGSLEQDGDIVAFLHRRHHRESGTTAFILEKQRNGPTGALNLTFDRDTQTFTDGGEDPPEPAPRKGKRQAPPAEPDSRLPDD